MLINKRHVKAYALEAAKERAHKFTRVGAEFFVRCDTNLKLYIRAQVRQLPSKSKTIR